MIHDQDENPDKDIPIVETEYEGDDPPPHHKKIPIDDPVYDPDEPNGPYLKKHPDEPPEDPFGHKPKHGPAVDPKPIDWD